METKSPLCYVRFLHACSGTSRMDLLINDTLIAENFNYKDFTEYFSASPGIYHLVLYPTGKRERVIFEEHLEINARSIYTVAATGKADAPSLSFICDKKQALPRNQAHMRLINLSPCRRKLHILLNDTLSIPDLAYQEVSDYVPVNPGRTIVKVQDPQTGQGLLSDWHQTLEAGKIYGAYIVGPDLEILPISPEGTWHLEF